MKMREIMEGFSQADMLRMANAWRDQYETSHQAAGPAERYHWRYEPRWKLDRIIDGMTPNERIEWMKDEIQMWIDEGDPDRFDGMLQEPIYEPVVAVEINGNAYLWDGNHRVGACLMSGRHTVPAIVGVPKQKP